MAPHRSDESRILDLLGLAIDEVDAGREPDLDALCRDEPELRREVQSALRAHRRIASAHARIGELDEAADTDPLLGQRLADRYLLLRRIGSGASGVVYAARDTTLARLVSVKLCDRFTGQDPERRARFRREALAAASLRHPGIVTVFDHGGDEQPYVVMELVPGVDLETLLAGQQDAVDPRRAVRDGLGVAAAAVALFDRPWAEIAASLALDVAEALDHAHSRGVLHRDVKPSNVLLRPDGRAVLLDFGLARIAGGESLTRDGEIVGTLSYMAPEQVRGREAGCDGRTDVYGAGAMLFRLLGGVPPFRGEPGVVLKRVLWDDPKPLARIAPRTPRDLVAICHKAMAKRPAERYQHAADLAADLRAFLDREAVSASLPGWPQRLLRRVRRRPERTGVVLLLTAAVPLAVLAWDGHQARAIARTRAAVLEARAAVPALLTIEGNNPSYSIGPRAPRDPGGAGRRALDAVLLADPDDVEARATRAMLQLDERRRAEGLVDLRALALRHPDSRLAAALCERVAALELDEAGSWRRTLAAELPASATPVDGFLRAYLLTRASRYGDARAALDEALRTAPGYEPALDLSMLVLLGVGDLNGATDVALRLEGAFGRSTARTRHVIGASQVLDGRWREAIGSFEESLRLCPEQHGPLQNLAFAHQQLGESGAALAVAEHAARVRPDAVQTWRTRMQLLAELGRSDDLQRLVAAARDLAPGPLWWLEFELGAAELRIAIRVLGVRPDDVVSQSCRDAAARLRTALELMHGMSGISERAEAQTYVDVATALSEANYHEAAGRMLAGLGGGARRAGFLRDAAMLSRRTPDGIDTAIFLLSEAHELAPDDGALAADLIETLIQRGGRMMLERAAGLWTRRFAAAADARAMELRNAILAAARADPTLEPGTLDAIATLLGGS
ncbi:MAG: protein kinase [Planctomycetes bacterium]|nr:protein kinase [Planctomycetota bacterium]